MGELILFRCQNVTSHETKSALLIFFDNNYTTKVNEFKIRR